MSEIDVVFFIPFGCVAAPKEDLFGREGKVGCACGVSVTGRLRRRWYKAGSGDAACSVMRMYGGYSMGGETDLLPRRKGLLGAGKCSIPFEMWVESEQIGYATGRHGQSTWTSDHRELASENMLSAATKIRVYEAESLSPCWTLISDASRSRQLLPMKFVDTRSLCTSALCFL